jgi:hypothetical protein
MLKARSSRRRNRSLSTARTSRYGFSPLVCALALAVAGAARAQRLTVSEAATGATAVFARRTFLGAELGIARRPGQGRLALTAAAGKLSGGLGMRLEASAQFLLKPGERAGTGLYGGLGVAFAGGTTYRSAGYLTALLGLESTPGRVAGWYTEVGLVGGVRLSAGRRWRRFPAWWR